MPADWIDRAKIAAQLRTFFNEEKAELERFGSTMNQVFEAHVFASVAARYREDGWGIAFVHPPASAENPTGGLRLKFSTRGRPNKYSFVSCYRGEETAEIRHQLRVATWYHRQAQKPEANVVLDVAVILPSNLDGYRTNDAIPNRQLLTFGEAKHMSAFAELIAAFIGLVHEMQPFRLGRKRLVPGHLQPFLYVSGFPMRTASGVIKTVRRRRYDVRFFCQGKGLLTRMPLPTIPSSKRARRKRAPASK